MLQYRQIFALLLGVLDTVLHVTQRVDVFLKLHSIRGSQGTLEPGYLAGYGVQNASFLSHAHQTRRWIGARVVSEQSLKNDARIVLHGQRRRRAAPGDRAGVCAAVTGIAPAWRVAGVKPQFERCNRGLAG